MNGTLYIPTTYKVSDYGLLMRVCRLWAEVAIKYNCPFPPLISDILDGIRLGPIRGLDDSQVMALIVKYGDAIGLFDIQAAIHNACLAGHPPKGLWAWCEFELRYLGHE